MTGPSARATNVTILHLPSRPLHTLPPQPTPLLGRDAELAAVRSCLADTGVRILTLTGPGGAGKTRLGVEAAAGMVDQFPDGVVFVDLVPLRDAGAVPAAIAQALDLRQGNSASVLATLVAAVRQMRLLLVLDNFEHVTAAANDIVELVSACPGIQLLITSRAPLRVRWEQEFPVPPLELPGPHTAADPAALATTASVTLFVQRAQAVRPAFALTAANARDIAAICTRLEGLPLAIELAAARIRILSPRALRSRLDGDAGTPVLQLLNNGAKDLPERQRSLRDTIAWSYELLSPMERTLFRRLAVFTGGWTAEAAEAVCAEPFDEAEAGPPTITVLDGLASLVEQSLVIQQDGPGGESRFGMLESIHEFSRERLAATNEEEQLRRRLTLHLLNFAQEGNRALHGAMQPEWIQRMEADHHNLRSALAWSLASGEAELALRLCAALTRFWYVKGYYREGRDWSDRALSAAPQASPEILAAALEGAGSLADIQHDSVDALRLLDASVDLWRTVGNGRRLAGALAMRAMLANHTGDNETARASCLEALTIPLDPPFRFGHRLALSVLGFIAEGDGDRTSARRYLDESLQVARENNSPLEIALQLNNLGVIALRDGQDDEAAEWYREALTLSWQISAYEIIAGSLEGFAGVAAARGRYQRAAEFFGLATALRTQIGGPPVAHFEEEYQRVLPGVREALGEAAFAAATAAGAALPLADAVTLALGTDDRAPAPPTLITGTEPPARPSRSALPDGLTPRQIDYLRLLAHGHTNKAIATALTVSETAVEQMLVRLYEKIHARNRAEAIHYAFAHGLVAPTTPA